MTPCPKRPLEREHRVCTIRQHTRALTGMDPYYKYRDKTHPVVQLFGCRPTYSCLGRTPQPLLHGLPGCTNARTDPVTHRTQPKVQVGERAAWGHEVHGDDNHQFCDGFDRNHLVQNLFHGAPSPDLPKVSQRRATTVPHERVVESGGGASKRSRFVTSSGSTSP